MHRRCLRRAAVRPFGVGGKYRIRDHRYLWILITTNYTLQYALVIPGYRQSYLSSPGCSIKRAEDHTETAKAPETPEVKKTCRIQPDAGTVIPIAEVPDDTFAAERYSKKEQRSSRNPRSRGTGKTAKSVRSSTPDTPSASKTDDGMVP